MTSIDIEVSKEDPEIQQTEGRMSTLEQMSRSTMQSKPAASGPPIMPIRRVERNKSSGPSGGRVVARRMPPKRSQSHKVGRPVFNKDLSQEPVRGVNRNASGRLRSAPNRNRSFGRSAPNRSRSGPSLKAKRKQQLDQQLEISDVDSVSDSVFTSASNQTLDSVMLRKNQITVGEGQEVASTFRMRKPRSDDNSINSFDFDESIRTVDSINLHRRNMTEEYNDDQCDLSVYSGSFASTDTYELSDYEEEIEEGNFKEVEIEDEIEDEDEPMQE